MPRGNIISCLKACKMISKVCLYYVVRVKDLECETSSIKLDLLVREFPEVFPNNLPRVLPKWEIVFGNDLLTDMNPNSIDPYRMTLAELKELNLKLKYLLLKGLS